MKKSRSALRNFGLSLVLGLTFSLSDIEAQRLSPDAFPAYQAPPSLPGVPGPVIILLPDGGTWTLNPPAMPEGFTPPPVYTPPPDDPHNGCRPHRRDERRKRYGD